MTHKVIEVTLASALAAAGTFTAGYPQGFDTGSFYAAYGHKIVTQSGDKFYFPADFTISLGATSITITSVDMVLAAGTKLYLQMELVGQDDGLGSQFDVRALKRTVALKPLLINLGAPDTADNDSMVKAATSTELPNAETVTYTPDTNGTTPTDGVQSVVSINGVNYWELDVPRNVFVNTTHGSSIVAMTVKVTGLDEYGVDMYEEISVAATGTNENDSGLKAFKWVRSIAFTAAGNAEANTCNVGFGDVLGLPVFISNVTFVTDELQDAARATAGTVVGGVLSAPTATTGDVRGTYDPNAACDAAKVFRLVCMVPDPSFKGLTQYAP